MNVKIKLVEGGMMPTYATTGSVGLDLYARVRDSLFPVSWNESNHTKKIPTGVCLEIPEGFEGQVRMRSSFGVLGVSMPHGVGTIDADYRGEVHVLLRNDGENILHILPGDRIAQLVISPIVRATLIEVQELSSTARGAGGFGSTGR